MKTATFLILAIIFSLGIAVSVHAQATNSLWIETDKTSIRPSDSLKITLMGASNVPVSGINFQLRYDPSCLQYKNANGLLPDMTPYDSNQPDLLDITFYGQAPQTVNGALAEVIFTVVTDCQTTITLENASLLALDDAGFAQPLQEITLGVTVISLGAGNGEQATLEISFTPEATQDPNLIPATSTPTPTGTLYTTPTPASTLSPSPPSNSSWFSILLVLAVGMMAVLAGIMILLFRRTPPKPPAPHSLGGTPSLYIERGPKAGETVALDKLPVRIGRGESNEINLPAQHLSRQHVQIYASHGAYYVADLGSKNGTCVNGKRIRNQSVTLRDGDRLKLGRDVLAEFRLQMDMELTI